MRIIFTLLLLAGTVIAAPASARRHRHHHPVRLKHQLRGLTGHNVSSPMTRFHEPIPTEKINVTNTASSIDSIHISADTGDTKPSANTGLTPITAPDVVPDLHR